MHFRTLYFNTGIELKYPQQYTIHCSQLDGCEDSMFDIVHYAWVPATIATVRSLQHGRPTYPMFQATADGTRELIAYLGTNRHSEEDWMHLLAATVLHQMGYQPELTVQFGW